MERITELTRDCFNALIQLRQLDEALLPPAEVLSARLRGFVDALLQRAPQLGFGHDDASDIAYAIVALADELVMGKSLLLQQSWAERPLQLHYFQENVAGEGFFTRLEDIRKDPRRREVLEAYYLALLFGFAGRYRFSGGEIELMNLTDAIRRELRRDRATDGDVLSPHADRPTEALARARQGAPLALWIGAAALGVALLVYVGLRVSIGVSAGSVADRIAAVQLP